MKYILFYKPYGVLCQFTDNSDNPRPTLKDYIPVPHVYSVGRLDRDSEGLLLLTDNGQLNNRLADPKFAHPRTYYVQVEGIPDESALNKLRRGVTIKNYRTRPVQVNLLSSEPDLPPRIPPIRDRQFIPTSWLTMTLTEGKNRQVRRMTAAVGFPTLRLVRISLGTNTYKLDISGLNPGDWRELSAIETKELLNFR
ncbi:MAG: pseudouridine synthase [Cyanobacteria bacterium P01_C01_bin.72]